MKSTQKIYIRLELEWSLCVVVILEFRIPHTSRQAAELNEGDVDVWEESWRMRCDKRVAAADDSTSTSAQPC